jgi:hypothetical protein
MGMLASPFGRENRFEKHEYLSVYIIGMNYYNEYYQGHDLMDAPDGSDRRVEARTSGGAYRIFEFWKESRPH